MLQLRVELKQSSDLGGFGAQAIRAALQARGVAVLPSVRTIGRILERRGALDGRYHLRRPAEVGLPAYAQFDNDPYFQGAGSPCLPASNE